MAAVAMAESAKAARKPPWTTPTGLARCSSAAISHTVTPGCDLSMQVMPERQVAAGRHARFRTAHGRAPPGRPRRPGPDQIGQTDGQHLGLGRIETVVAAVAAFVASS